MSKKRPTVDAKGIVESVTSKFPKFTRRHGFILLLIVTITTGTVAVFYFYTSKSSAVDSQGKTANQQQAGPFTQIADTAVHQSSGGNENVQIGSVGDGSTVVVSQAKRDPLEKISTEELTNKAVALHEGKNGKRNLSEAAKMLDEAVNRGDSRAMTIKGNWLLDGVTYRKDPKEAFRLWEQAAAQGYPQAAFNRGEYAFQLSGGDNWQDQPYFQQFGLHRAIHWYLVAAKDGHETAISRLKREWPEPAWVMLQKEYPDDVPALKEVLKKK